jgi:hypothetical protein
VLGGPRGCEGRSRVKSAIRCVASFALMSLFAGVSRGSQVAADNDLGSICLLSIADPTPGEKSLYNHTGGNPEPDYSVRFGEGALIQVPHSPKAQGPGLLVTGFPVDRTYLTKVYLKGKRIESFRFRLPAKERNQCMFLREFYLTWDFSLPGRLDGCRCKGANSTAWK